MNGDVPREVEGDRAFRLLTAKPEQSPTHKGAISATIVSAAELEYFLRRCVDAKMHRAVINGIGL
jgi:hypothetical protein